MGRKSDNRRIAQRKKPYLAKRGSKSARGHRGGRRWCHICSRRLGVEKRFRRVVREALQELRSQRIDCPTDCECMACVGDSHCAGKFTDLAIKRR